MRAASIEKCFRARGVNRFCLRIAVKLRISSLQSWNFRGEEMVDQSLRCIMHRRSHWFLLWDRWTKSCTRLHLSRHHQFHHHVACMWTVKCV